MLKSGQLVMLIGSDGFTPPYGAIGEVVGYDTGDYEVDFPKHPCPVGEPTWFCAPSWLMPIDAEPEQQTEEKEETCPT